MAIHALADKRTVLCCLWGCVRPNVSTPSHTGQRNRRDGASRCSRGFTCDLQDGGHGALFFHRTVPSCALRQSIPSSLQSGGISFCCKYVTSDSESFFPAVCVVCCLQNKIQKSADNHKMDLLLLGLGNLVSLGRTAMLLLSRQVTVCVMQIRRRVKSSEGRGRWNLRCDSGHLIFGAHLRQLLSAESFFSHCQELL